MIEYRHHCPVESNAQSCDCDNLPTLQRNITPNAAVNYPCGDIAAADLV